MAKRCPSCGGNKWEMLSMDHPDVPRCANLKCRHIIKHIDKTRQDYLPVERRDRVRMAAIRETMPNHRRANRHAHAAMNEAA